MIPMERNQRIYLCFMLHCRQRSRHKMTVRQYEQKDLNDMIRIWNEVVEEGIAFPQENTLKGETGKAFLGAQSYCGV